MPVIYDLAPPDVHDLATEVMRAHHQRLKLGGVDYVKLCLLMAKMSSDNESDEPAVKLHGYPCAAIISVIPYKQRVDKRADAEIVIDADAWDDMTEPQQMALLDHEITHLEIVTDKDGLVKTDDQGRPKLRLRIHDWQIGGFREVVMRHGSDAPETVQAREFSDKHGGLVLANTGALAFG